MDEERALPRVGEKARAQLISRKDLDIVYWKKATDQKFFDSLIEITVTREFVEACLETG